MNYIKIGDLFDFQKGCLQSSKCIEGDFDFITASADWKSHNEFSHDEEALVVAVAASGSLGRIHYVNGKFIASDLCFILSPKNQEYPIDLEFYFHIFKYLRDDLVRTSATGTSKLAINKTNFGKYKIPYLNIDKQQKLKIKIKKIQNSKELLIKSNNIKVGVISNLRKSILTDAITGKLSREWRKEKNIDESASQLLERIKAKKKLLIAEKKINKQKPFSPIIKDEIPFEIPKNWTWCRLGEVGLFERGKSKHRPRNDASLFSDGIYPFVQTGDVARSKETNFQIMTYDKKYNEKGLKQSRIWGAGTLCITIAANIAETGFLTFDACFPDSVVGFTPLSSKSISQFIRIYLDSTKNEIERFAPATAQKNINLGIINNLVFPLPPENEFEFIVEKTNNILNRLAKIEKKNTKIKEYIEKLDQSIIAEILK